MYLYRRNLINIKWQTNLGFMKKLIYMNFFLDIPINIGILKLINETLYW